MHVPFPVVNTLGTHNCTHNCSLSLLGLHCFWGGVAGALFAGGRVAGAFFAVGRVAAFFLCLAFLLALAPLAAGVGTVLEAFAWLGASTAGA